MAFSSNFCSCYICIISKIYLFISELTNIPLCNVEAIYFVLFIYLFIYFSSVNPLIVINCVQNNSLFTYDVCLLYNCICI